MTQRCFPLYLMEMVVRRGDGTIKEKSISMEVEPEVADASLLI